jgi:hypothetical protein
MLPQVEVTVITFVLDIQANTKRGTIGLQKDKASSCVAISW